MSEFDDDVYVITGLADDYVGQLFSGWQGDNGYIRFKRRGFATRRAARLAVQRERARFMWIGDRGLDPSRWPVPHPPAVLRAAGEVAAACLRCAFLSISRAERRDPTPFSARTAARHSLRNGGDPAWLDAHPPRLWAGTNRAVGVGDIRFEQPPLPHDPDVTPWWGSCRSCGARSPIDGLTGAGTADVWTDHRAMQWAESHRCD